MAKKGKAKAVKTRAKAKVRRRRAVEPPPPYKCRTTLEPGWCLRFDQNPRTGQYNLPPGGTRVRCTECDYWFD
jgi:hypothetical protein